MVQLVHVGYAEEREDLFIMALPATKVSCQAFVLTTYVTTLVYLNFLGRQQYFCRGG